MTLYEKIQKIADFAKNIKDFKKQQKEEMLKDMEIKSLLKQIQREVGNELDNKTVKRLNKALLSL